MKPRVGYQAVPRDWAWTDSDAAATELWNPRETRALAEQDRGVARVLGSNRERIVRIITTIEVMDEGDDSEITPRA